MKKFNLVSLLVVALFVVLAIPVYAQGESCGKIEITMNNGSKIQGTVVIEKTAEGELILRPRFEGYKEPGSWLAVVGPENLPQHKIQKMILGCGKKK